MADVKSTITQLEELETLTQGCYIIVDDGENTYKFNANNLGGGGGSSVRHFTPENIVQGTITNTAQGEVTE